MNKYFFAIVFLFCQIWATAPLAAQTKEAKLTEKINLSDDDLALFKKETEIKIKEFQDHIVIVADKAQSKTKRDMAEKEALKLFFDGASMEISIIRAGGKIDKVVRPMADYLYRLKTLPFTKVTIKFYDVLYMTEFKKGTDGRYYGTATVIQEFTGFNGDKIAYHDITKKEITIIIDIVVDEFFNENHWKIFLGDIKATETRK